MSYRRLFFTLVLWLLTLCCTWAQQYRLQGRVVDVDTGGAVEYASVLLAESGLWAVTDAQGSFTIKAVPAGTELLTVQCLGYEKYTLRFNLKRDVTEMVIRLRPATLKVSEVTVTARRKQDEATTSYTIDRHALDQQQILNISDLAVLLPGGKTTNPTLMSDNRISLRSASQEKGNASFGTAIEIDGMRLDNNAATGETMGASTRTVSASDVESVEIVTGIPSVEYGDLSNGIVKVSSRRGKSPFIVEGRLTQHTRQATVAKGFSPGQSAGVLNASLEHARSFSDAASPHTAYQRNILSLRYGNVFFQLTTPLTLSFSLTGNVGGYNSEADPDEELDDYQKARDNALRASLDAQWLLNKPWITNVQLQASFSYQDRRQESYSHTSSASTQPYLHTTEEGYFIADLGPTGYWYVRSFNDSKPMSWATKLKADWTHRFGRVASRFMAGTQWQGSRNAGRGTYYDDPATTPTWREYRYDRLPTMNNVAFYMEEKVVLSALELTAGLRDDVTLISGSDYGTVSSLSPRANARYVFWRGQRRRWVSQLELHAGWGKSVKLPSMQVLYPAPSYSDLLAFASTSTADNTSYYAYHTFPTAAQYNPQLRWQYTGQADVGVELTVKRGTRISLSAFHHKTHHSYMSSRTYTPFTYRYTGQTAVQQSGIPAEERQFSIDRQTGVVTVHSAADAQRSTELPYTDRRTYTTNQHYENATPLSRYGLEWMVDFAQIRALRTSLRLDGNYYYYKGVDDVLFADVPLGVSNIMSDGQPYQYVGYYRGSNVTSAGSSANASVSNGALSRQLNLNATLTTHIPRIRLVVALRLESSLYSYRRALSQFSDGSSRGYMLDEAEGYFGQPYDGTSRDKFVVVYPEYYTTWEQPGELLPFAERFLWARDNDQQLYNDLSKLVVRSNYAYTMNPNRLSSYYSANLSVTKELGDHIALSFYANNFLNNMRRVRSSQTDLQTSLFESGYIPSYYYGLSLRIKI
ncbi:MAG: TonB-dependent receptor [Prevotella sp.]|nr:TonB-dependent receptor [Prevotella sp.]